MGRTKGSGRLGRGPDPVRPAAGQITPSVLRVAISSGVSPSSV
jgi:hypothetical protein